MPLNAGEAADVGKHAAKLLGLPPGDVESADPTRRAAGDAAAVSILADRKDGYSRGISGSSSGGICAFNVAWWQPEQFSRVLSNIGSFTSIQWHPGEIAGGNVYPFKIRKEPKLNIRVWLQDGTEDLENNHGSWPLQNLQMANSLKMMDYDFHHEGVGHLQVL